MVSDVKVGYHMKLLLPKDTMINEKLAIVIETVKNERVYGFTISYGSPYADAFAALDDFRNHLDALHKKQIENQVAQEAEKKSINENNS